MTCSMSPSTLNAIRPQWQPPACVIDWFLLRQDASGRGARECADCRRSAGGAAPELTRPAARAVELQEEEPAHPPSVRRCQPCPGRTDDAPRAGGQDHVEAEHHHDEQEIGGETIAASVRG